MAMPIGLGITMGESPICTTDKIDNCNTSQSTGLVGTGDNDSGYATGTNTTPDTLRKKHDNIWKSEADSGNGRSVRCSAKYGNLQEFDQVVLRETVDQFKSVATRLQTALVAYMRKHFDVHYPMSMRLMVLGETAEDAKPWIVVFCHKSRERRARRFFKKSFARDLCQRNDLSRTTFEVLVLGHAVQTNSSPTIEVLTDYDFAAKTLSGIPIQFSQGQQSQQGTLGGLIKIVGASGEYQIFGITAGHLLEPFLANTLKTPPDSEDENTDSGEPTSSGDDSDSQQGQCRSTDSLILEDGCSHEAVTGRLFHPYWSSIGYVNRQLPFSPTYDQFTPRKYDWSLIQVNRQAYLQPNLLRAQADMKPRTTDLVMPSEYNGEFTTTRNVQVNNCSEECQTGKLSPLPCSIWLGHDSEGFVEVFSLQLNGDTGIRRGDSGSWVVANLSLQVYGHLVASDGLGDGYVMPLLPTLEEIRQAVGAETVELATAVDIACLKGDMLFDPEAVTAPPSQSPIFAARSVQADEEQDCTSSHGRPMNPAGRDPKFIDSGYVSATHSPQMNLDRNVSRRSRPDEQLQTPARNWESEQDDQSQTSMHTCQQDCQPPPSAHDCGIRQPYKTRTPLAAQSVAIKQSYRQRFKQLLSDLVTVVRK